MSHTIIYNSEEHLIEMEVQGDLDLNEVKETSHEIALLVKETNCFLIFADYREAEVKLSTLEIYQLPKILSEIHSSVGGDVRRLKRALLVASDLKDFHFYETVAANRAQKSKVFQDFDKAKKWLSDN